MATARPKRAAATAAALRFREDIEETQFVGCHAGRVSEAGRPVTAHVISAHEAARLIAALSSRRVVASPAEKLSPTGEETRKPPPQKKKQKLTTEQQPSGAETGSQENQEEESLLRTLRKEKRRSPTRPRVVAFSGSGISASAGLATFSASRTGLYARAKKKYKLASGMALFTYKFFADRPCEAQQFLAQMLDRVSRCVPTPTHHALVSLERAGELQRHYTMNIDGLHVRAGASTWGVYRDESRAGNNEEESNDTNPPPFSPDGKTVELHGALRELVDVATGEVYDVDDAALARIRAKKPAFPARRTNKKKKAGVSAARGGDQFKSNPGSRAPRYVVDLAAREARRLARARRERETTDDDDDDDDEAEDDDQGDDDEEGGSQDADSDAPPLRVRFRVMLYGDEQHDCVVDADRVFALMEDDLKDVDVVLWLGISFEQSASCDYLRRAVRLAKRDAIHLIVNPSPEAAFNARSSLDGIFDETAGAHEPGGDDAWAVDLRAVRATSDDFFEALVREESLGVPRGEEGGDHDD